MLCLLLLAIGKEPYQYQVFVKASLQSGPPSQCSKTTWCSFGLQQYLHDFQASLCVCGDVQSDGEKRELYAWLGTKM